MIGSHLRSMSLFFLLLLAPSACTEKVSSNVSPPPPEPTAELSEPESIPTPPAPAVNAMRLEYERNTIDVFRRAAPTTVFVTQKRLVRDNWSLRQSEVETGTGSGFVWDERGHIVTNYHVVANGSSFIVTLVDGSDHEAKIVGGDPNKDVAVLKIDPAGVKTALIPVTFAAPSEKLEVGQTTIAIGNPFGLDHTLTVGVVSAIGREVKGYGGVTIRDMIQTDASINPGNSGGPLLDSGGRLIGMNTMIFTKVGQSSGIGFAVPAPTLQRVVPQLIQYGRPQRVGFGIEIVPDNLARRSGIRGVVIGAVARSGPAAKAGLRGLQRTSRGTVVGDVIVAIDGKPIAGYDDLYNALDARKPGTLAKVTLDRDGKRVDVEIKLVLVE